MSLTISFRRRILPQTSTALPFATACNLFFYVIGQRIDISDKVFAFVSFYKFYTPQNFFLCLFSEPGETYETVFLAGVFKLSHIGNAEIVKEDLDLFRAQVWYLQKFKKRFRHSLFQFLKIGHPACFNIFFNLTGYGLSDALYLLQFFLFYHFIKIVDSRKVF